MRRHQFLAGLAVGFALSGLTFLWWLLCDPEGRDSWDEE